MTCPSEARPPRLASPTALLQGAACFFVACVFVKPAAAQVAGGGGADAPFAGGSLFDRDRPGGVTVGALAVEERPAVTLVTRHEHTAAGSLAGRGELAFAGRTVGVSRHDPLDLGPPSVARPGDRVALRLVGSARPGDRMRAVRIGRRLRSGHRVVHATALLELLSVAGDSAVAAVHRVFGAYRAGDPVVPLETFAPPGSRLEPVPDGRVVRVLGSEDDRLLLGPGDRLFLDAGSASGVGPGDEFELLGTEGSLGVGAEHGPSVGTVRVVRAERHTATARIVELRAGSAVGASRARLARRPAGSER